MSNIISADIFRVRKGAALRNTFIGILLVVTFVTVVIALSQSETVKDMMTGMEGLSEKERIELQADLADAQGESAVIDGGAALGSTMLEQSFIPIFFLPLFITVFCADFSAGTYRNTLSYETNRTRVYLAKLALSAVLCIALVLVMLIFSWVLGSIVFGTAGFSVAYFTSTLLAFVLQLPIYLAAVAIGHFLVAFTKSSSATIAIYIIGFIGIAITLNILATSNLGLDWLNLLEPQTAISMMVNHATAATTDILIVVVYNLALAVITTLLGVLYYRKTDMP